MVSGLALAAKGLLAFATIGMFWGGITVITAPERVRSDSFLFCTVGVGTHSFVAGWLCLAVSTSILILTMDRWVKVLPGFFPHSAFSSLIHDLWVLRRRSSSTVISSGTVVPLADALGSVIALTNSSGSIATMYSYDPFGNTTTSGAVSRNPSQYTGRENEGNGLYFYRARYYNPGLGRLISEDPVRWSGVINFYAYGLNSPTNYGDPSGKWGILGAC